MNKSIIQQAKDVSRQLQVGQGRTVSAAERRKQYLVVTRNLLLSVLCSGRKL
ncbi:hypothetical protein [Fodinibius halophilus]|uniref:Uncharacterized protein n=1 Tax=Fodinibius halophilus TaxID=1736908 RepID=A0A6M1STT8_9BACT|nr:hypothetical protein [Fodinibius halophilus]NGP86966.1 hypothetical protein [Fodinibius halophilus]